MEPSLGKWGVYSQCSSQKPGLGDTGQIWGPGWQAWAANPDFPIGCSRYLLCCCVPLAYI